MDDFGLPDLTDVDPARLEAGIREKLEGRRALLEAITPSQAPATVENTLPPSELKAQRLEEAVDMLHMFAASVGGDEWHAVEARLNPLIVEHEDDVYLDSQLYDRFKALGSAGLGPETAWCVSKHLKAFRVHGCHLDTVAQERLRTINKEAADLTTEFGQLALKAQLAGSVPLTEEGTEGLSESQKAGLMANAESNPELTKGKPCLVVPRFPTQQPAQSALVRADVRERIFETSTSRDDGSDPATDTRRIVLALARLRVEKAQILGYSTYVQYVAAREAVGSTWAIHSLLEPMIEFAQRNAEAKHEALETYAEAPVAPSDWFYFHGALARGQFQLDSEVLVPYLKLTNVAEGGVFYAANRLYGLTSSARPDLHGYTEGVKIWEVRREGSALTGPFLGDYSARTGERGGAWMHTIWQVSWRGGECVVVCNDLNVARPPEGEPALLTWDEVETAFHEFGHALHSLLFDVEWPSAVGANVLRDFVEYPSQVNEIWARHPEVLANYAQHFATGEPMPEDLAASLSAANGFGAGFQMSEMLQAVFLDQAWHGHTPADLPEGPDDVEEFEKATLKRLGIASPWIPPRYRSCYFNHVFSGGYSAGYYSCLWSETLDADTTDWFRTVAAENGDGGLNYEAGAKMTAEVLSRRNSRNPPKGFERLLGRPVDTRALLRRKRLLRIACRRRLQACSGRRYPGHGLTVC